MRKWQQRFSIGYFVVAVVLLFALQSFFASPRVETITYSQFKALARKGLMTNVVVGEKEIRGEIKLLEKEVVETPALQSILKAKMTKDARDVMQSPSDDGSGSRRSGHPDAEVA
jgi:FtsH Extracellular